MSILKILTNRVSCRQFQSDKKVPADILQKIAEAGRIAPSACNLQPWKFLFVSSESMLEDVKSCYSADWLKTAPHILIVVADSSEAWKRSDGYNSVETDATIAMDHMILEAEANGVATCWIAAFDNRKLRKILHVAKDEEIFAITPLGYAADEKAIVKAQTSKKRKASNQVVKFL